MIKWCLVYLLPITEEFSVFSDKINLSADAMATPVAEPLAGEKLTSNVKSASSLEVEFTVLCSLKSAHQKYN